jgi:hypothetical protein
VGAVTNSLSDIRKTVTALGALTLLLLMINAPAEACGDRQQGERHHGGRAARVHDWHDAHPAEWRGWNVGPAAPIEGPPDVPPAPDGLPSDGPPSMAPPDVSPPGPLPTEDELYRQRLRDERAQLYEEIENLKAQRRQLKAWDPQSAELGDIKLKIEERRDKAEWISKQLRGSH